MKRISFICVLAALAAAALFPSCKKTPQDLTSYYKIYAYGVNSFRGFSADKDEKVGCYVKTTDDGLDVPLTVKFKVDESLVSKFNSTRTDKEKAVILPQSCYELAPSATVRSMYRMSGNAFVTLKYSDELEQMSWYVLPVVIDEITGSPLAHISQDADNVLYIVIKTAKSNPGKGTAEEPYVIYDADDMLLIRERCKEVTFSTTEEADAAVPTYFKLMDDVDLSGIDWIPYNYDELFKRKIDFNGNHKTISNLTSSADNKYASLFGVLFGDVYDLNIVNANVSSNKTAGIVAGYVGTSQNGCDYNSHVRRVYAQGKVKGLDGGMGGICGRCHGSKSTIEECCTDVEVAAGANKNFVAGIVGYDNAAGVTIQNCIAKGPVTGFLADDGGGSQRVGGIIGMLYKDGSKVIDCIAVNTVKGARCIGGIAGHANSDKWDERHPGNVVRGCIAWNPEIISTQISEKGASNGAVIGFTSEFNTLENCIRRPDMKYTFPAPGFAVGENNPNGIYNTFFDMDNCSESSPLSPIVHDNSQELYRVPYNGKAAAEGATASDVAKKLGWDETVWDLSGEIPALKNVYAE